MSGIPLKPSRRIRYPNTCRLVITRLDFTTDGDERFILTARAGRQGLGIEACVGDARDLFDLAKKVRLSAVLRAGGRYGQSCEVRILPWATMHRGERWKRALYVKYSPDFFGADHDLLRDGLWLSTDAVRYSVATLGERRLADMSDKRETCRLVIVGGPDQSADGGTFVLEARDRSRRFARFTVRDAQAILEIAKTVPLTARIRVSATSDECRETPVYPAKYRSGALGLVTPKGTDILIHGLIEVARRRRQAAIARATRSSGGRGHANP